MDQVSTEEARHMHLDLAHYCTEGGRTGALRQIVRRLHELDTPETDIQEATGLTADQLEMLAAKTGTDQPPLTIDRNASAQALLVLGGIYKEELGLELRLRDAVAAARRSGCSWEMIGAMLGTSRQAAQERFGKSDQQQAS